MLASAARRPDWRSVGALLAGPGGQLHEVRQRFADVPGTSGGMQ